MLGEEAASRLQQLRVTTLVGLHGDERAYPVPIALPPGEAERDLGVLSLEVVPQEADLRARAAHEDHVRVSVTVVVAHRKGPAVVNVVEPEGAGDVDEAPRPVVVEEDVALATVPGAARSDHAVDGPPAVLVGGPLLLRERRVCHDLAPEEAIEIVRVGVGHEAVRDVDVFPAVAVQIERITGPGPAALRGEGRKAHVLEGPIAAVSEERVASRVVAVELADLRRGLRLELGLVRDAQAGCRPHLAGIDVEPPVVVVVEPRHAHARLVVAHPRLRRHVGERDLPVPPAIAVVEVLPAVVVGHDQVGPAVTIVIGPRGLEAVAVVVLVEARGLGHVREAPVSVVPEESVGGAVFRVVIGHGEPIPPLGLEIGVGGEVDVQEAVPVEVGDRGPGESGVRAVLQAEGSRLLREAAFAVVQEQERLLPGRHDQVLVAVVVDVDEERHRSRVQDADTGGLGDVGEGAVAPVPEEPVGQAGRLADVEVVEAIAVDVGGGDAVVAEDVGAERTIDDEAPVVDPGTELAIEVRLWPSAAAVTSRNRGSEVWLRV